MESRHSQNPGNEGKYFGQTQGRASTPSGQLAQTPLEFIQSQVDVPVSSETSLGDLGLDSLELLDLQLECEKQFGKRITDAQQAQLHSVGDLANFFS